VLTTTFKLAKEAGACVRSYKKYAYHIGGVRKYGQDTPINLTDIAEVCGIQDALWVLCCVQEFEESKRLARLLAADFAEHVLHFYEEKYPEDDRPRKAVEAARQYAQGEIEAAASDAAAWAARAAALDAASAAAWDAAWAARAAASDAARDAAWAAAWAARAAARDAAWAASDAAAWAARAAASDAARDAARDAEKEWQKQRFIKVLSYVTVHEGIVA
jgi:hypothetical protein